MRKVPGVGDPKAKLMLVGEAPGADEVREGVPFVGAAGRLLTRMLAAAGLTRENLWITNVVKIRPPDNKYGRLPETGYTEKDFIPELIEEMQRVQPNAVVAFGANVARVLAGVREMGDWRGSVLPGKLYPGAPKVVVTVHPAAVLHMGKRDDHDSIFADPGVLAHVITMDLQRAKEQAEFPELPLGELRMQLKPSFWEIERYVKECLDRGMFAYDIETLPGNVIRCLGLAHSHNSSLCIPFRNGLACAWPEAEEMAIWRLLGGLFQSPGVLKVAQNQSFDLTLLTPLTGYPAAPLFDTMLAHHLLAPELPHNLNFINSTYGYLGHYDLKGSINTHADYDVWVYNCKDCMATYAAAVAMIEELKERQLDRFFSGYIMPLATCLFEMQNRGVKIDQAKRQELAEPLRQELVQLQQEIDAKAQADCSECKGAGRIAKRYETLTCEQCHGTGKYLNINSPSQLVDYFYKSGKHKAKLHYKRKTPTVDKNALTTLAAKGDEVANFVIDARERHKMVSTFLEAPLDEDGCMYTDYKIAGTTTGRLASAEPTLRRGSNLQNQPYKAREAFVPREGMVFVKADLSQAEARVVAWLTKGRMQQAFRRDEDVHQLTADLMDIDRSLAKRINHAANYGMGPVMMSMQLRVPQREASRLLNLYHKVYPEVQVWQQHIIDTLKNNQRTLITPFGRVRQFLGNWNEHLFRAAFAFIPQSTVADYLNLGLVELWLRLAHLKLYAYPLLQVHDEIVVECLLAHAVAVQELLHQCLERPIVVEGEEFVIPAESKICYQSWVK